jgi:hypothetical protein
MEDREAAAAAVAPQSSKAQTERRAKESTAPMVTSPTAPKSKAQRLAELTEAYRRDEITPAQYHQERAKILAEPNEKP